MYVPRVCVCEVSKVYEACEVTIYSECSFFSTKNVDMVLRGFCMDE